MKTIIKSLTALGIIATALTGIAPAMADGWDHHDGYEQRDHEWRDHHREDWRERGAYRHDYHEGYGRPVYYGRPTYQAPVYYGHTVNQGYRCNRGTTGTIIGAIAGGLLGREIGRGGYDNRPSTTGTIIGAGAGALAGRAIERSGHNGC